MTKEKSAYDQGFEEGEKRVQDAIHQGGLKNAIQLVKDSLRASKKGRVTDTQKGLREALKQFLHRHGEPTP